MHGRPHWLGHGRTCTDSQIRNAFILATNCHAPCHANAWACLAEALAGPRRRHVRQGHDSPGPGYDVCGLAARGGVSATRRRCCSSLGTFGRPAGPSRGAGLRWRPAAPAGEPAPAPAVIEAESTAPQAEATSSDLRAQPRPRMSAPGAAAAAAAAQAEGAAIGSAHAASRAVSGRHAGPQVRALGRQALCMRFGVSLL